MPNLPWWGYAFLSALFAALTTIFAKIGIQNVNSNLATAIRTSVVLVIVWGIVLSTGEVRAIRTIPSSVWLWLVLSAAGTGLSWLAYFRALQVGPTAAVAAIDRGSLPLVLLLSALLLNEPLTWRSAAGIVVIFGGILLLVFK